MSLPQMARKETLRAVMSDTLIGLVLPWREREGIALFREVQSLQQEGIMAKHRAAPYVEGKRVDWWLKVKNFQEGTFYVCGLTEGENERNSTFGSLILGELRDGKLVYVGNVGSGFDQRQLVELTAYFGSLKGECPFGQADVGRSVKFWTTKPVVRCEVRFLEWGKDGKLRFPTFRRIVNR